MIGCDGEDQIVTVNDVHHLGRFGARGDIAERRYTVALADRHRPFVQP